MSNKLSVWKLFAQETPADELKKIISTHIDNCVTTQDTPILDFYPEGPDLYDNGCWKIIEECVDEKQLDISEIQIDICDYNADYPCKVVKKQPAWLNKVLLFPNAFNTNGQHHEAMFGHFVARPSWDRIVLHDAIKKTNNALYSFWQGKDKPYSYRTTIKKLKQYYPGDWKKYKHSLDSMPDANINTSPNRQQFITFPDNVLPLKNYYEKIFVDIVSETFTTGTTSFITEKTVRPIVYKCPFIIMAGKGYLEVLKEFGFKTFSTWWDEDYDNYTGPERLEKIIELIKTLSQEKHVDTLKLELHRTLEHNYDHIVQGKWKKHADRLGVKDE